VEKRPEDFFHGQLSPNAWAAAGVDRTEAGGAEVSAGSLPSHTRRGSTVRFHGAVPRSGAGPGGERAPSRIGGAVMRCGRRQTC